MSLDRDYVYWDSCVFLQLLDRSGPGQRSSLLDGVIHEIEHKPNTRILTSAITKVEVAFAGDEKTHSKLDSEVERTLDELWGDYQFVTVVELHDGISKQARELMRSATVNGKGLKTMDAIQLASACWVAKTANVSEFCTYDKKLLKYGPSTGLTICEPHIVQCRMF